MLAYHVSEGPDDRPYVGAWWYEDGEVLEIIEQVPPEMDRLRRDAPPAV
jgi:hypothetical protein